LLAFSVVYSILIYPWLWVNPTVEWCTWAY